MTPTFGKTTCFATIGLDAALMTGKEQYRAIGHLVHQGVVNKIIKELKGLTRNWSCIEKAQKAQEILGYGKIMIGSLYIFNIDFSGSYGYAYNPPYEFHAWLKVDQSVVDFALPGAIEMGLQTKDALGYILTMRRPFILVGHPPLWIRYTEMETYNEHRMKTI